MEFGTEHRLDSGGTERSFTLGDIPGILWTPPDFTASSPPMPLILVAHPGGLEAMRPRLVARARAATDLGFCAATLELPSCGTRDRIPAIEDARAEMRRMVTAGRMPTEEIIDSFILPLVEEAVPEWQALLDDVLELPELGGPVGISGGVIAVGTRLALVEPRIEAAGLFAGSFIPRATIEDARQVTTPLHVLLQWDDHGNDRQRALELFDAFGSSEKTLQANLGGHTGVPAHAGEDAARFFVRHLKPQRRKDLRSRTPRRPHR